MSTLRSQLSDRCLRVLTSLSTTPADLFQLARDEFVSLGTLINRLDQIEQAGIQLIRERRSVRVSPESFPAAYQVAEQYYEAAMA